MKVCIAGLLPAQQNLVFSSAPSGVELRFVDGQRISGWFSAAQECDVCISMVKFVRHCHEDCWRRHAKRVVRHAGGMTGLVAKVQQLYEDHVDLGIAQKRLAEIKVSGG